MTAIRMQDGATRCWRSHDQAGLDPLDTDGDRLRDEFQSMPALCLTVPQVARLLTIPVVSATRLLRDLEREGFLIRTPLGAYRLARFGFSGTRAL